MGELYVVQSKLKEFIKKQGCNTSAEALEKFSKMVELSAAKAAERAKANKRKTVLPQDV